MIVKGLTTLVNKESISMEKDVFVDLCEYYLFGKQHKVSLCPTRKNRYELLSLVHFDVCGTTEEDDEVYDENQEGVH